MQCQLKTFLSFSFVFLLFFQSITSYAHTPSANTQFHELITRVRALATQWEQNPTRYLKAKTFYRAVTEVKPFPDYSIYTKGLQVTLSSQLTQAELDWEQSSTLDTAVIYADQTIHEIYAAFSSRLLSLTHSLNISNYLEFTRRIDSIVSRHLNSIPMEIYSCSVFAALGGVTSALGCYMYPGSLLVNCVSGISCAMATLPASQTLCDLSEFHQLDSARSRAPFLPIPQMFSIHPSLICKSNRNRINQLRTEMSSTLTALSAPPLLSVQTLFILLNTLHFKLELASEDDRDLLTVPPMPITLRLRYPQAFDSGSRLTRFRASHILPTTSADNTISSPPTQQAMKHQATTEVSRTGYPKIAWGAKENEREETFSQPASQSPQLREEIICAICLQEITDSGVKLACHPQHSHYFHENCLREHARGDHPGHNLCPLCKRPYDTSHFNDESL